MWWWFRISTNVLHPPNAKMSYSTRRTTARCLLSAHDVTTSAKHMTPPKWWLGATAVLLCAAVGASIFLWSHTPGQSAWLPPCFFHELTGLLCTGCGVTRAAHALVHGQWAHAWAMNPLAVISIPVAALLWVQEGLSRPPRLEKWLSPLRSAQLWMVVVVVFTVGRNLPWWPFSTWAPH